MGYLPTPENAFSQMKMWVENRKTFNFSYLRESKGISLPELIIENFKCHFTEMR